MQRSLHTYCVYGTFVQRALCIYTVNVADVLSAVVRRAFGPREDEEGTSGPDFRFPVT